MTRLAIHPTRAVGMVIRSASAVAALSLVLSCQYPTDNPLDPEYPLSIAIQGPDTLYTYGEQATLTYTTTPSVKLPDGVARWSSTQPKVLAVTPYGSIGAVTSAAYPAPVDITLRIGPHTATKRVVVWQRPVRIVFSSPQMAGDSVVVDGARPFSITVRVLDAGNSAINAAATLIPSDTSKVVVDSYGGLTAIRHGRSYVLVDADGLRDSVVVYDRELPTNVSVLPCTYTYPSWYADPIIRVGDSLQLSFAFTGAGGAKLDSVPIVTGYVPMDLTNGGLARVVLTPGGWIKPLAAGPFRDRVQFRTWDGVTGELEGCDRDATP